MSWKTPRTWATGDQLSGDTTASGSLNLQVRDQLIALRGMNEYAQRMSKSAVQSINSAAYTAVSFNVIDWEAGTTGLHNTASATKLMAPIAGVYELAGCLEWSNTTTPIYFGSAYRENGTSGFHISTQTGTDTGRTLNLPFGAIVKLTSGEYIEVMAWQNSGGALNLTKGTDRTHCSWRLLGGAT